MARQRRSLFPDAVYHVTSRGNRGQDVFLDDFDRRDFLDRLGRASGRYNLRIHAFCLMSNHYHLFLRTPEPNLADAMRWINSSYALRLNRRYRQSGHVLQGRYKAALVVEQAHWINLSFYIHLNPVRAGMVDDPGIYEWSSFNDYIRARPRYDWLVADEVLSLFGPTDAVRRRRYRREALALAGNPIEFWEEARAELEDAAREAVESLASMRRRGRGASPRKAVTGRRPKVDVDAEIKRVAGAFGVDVSELAGKRRNFPPKLAIYYHLVENLGMRMSEAARAMEVNPGSISMGLRRFRALLDGDRRLRKKMKPLSIK